MHPELVAARRAIALGKLTAFSAECWRLAGLCEAGAVAVTDAIDALAEADAANDLSTTFGVDLVQNTMADAFSGGVYGIEEPPPVEAAA